MKNIYKAIIIGCMLLSYPLQSFAQTLTLSMTPPLVEATIKPGKSILIAYTVSNIGDPSILSGQIRPFKASGQNGELEIADEFSGPIRFELDNSNIKLGDPFFLESKQGQQLLLKIRVPEGTPEGDYYYTFIVSNELGKPTEGVSATQSIGSIGSNILITVTETGEIDIQTSIGELDVIPRYVINLFGKKLNIFESTDTIPIRLVVQNHGRNMIKPNGEIQLTGNFGERATFGILPQNILSQSSRLIQATPSAQLTDAKSSLNISGFFVGKYIVDSKVSFGAGTETLTGSVEFYGIPLKLLAATLSALIIGYIVVKKIGRQDPS